MGQMVDYTADSEVCPLSRGSLDGLKPANNDKQRGLRMGWRHFRDIRCSLLGAVAAGLIWGLSFIFQWDFMDALQMSLADIEGFNADNLIFLGLLVAAGMVFDFVRMRARQRRDRELANARLRLLHATARTLEDRVCNDLTAMRYLIESTDPDEPITEERRSKLLDLLLTSTRQVQDLLTLEDTPETLDAAGQARLDLETARRSDRDRRAAS